MPEMTIRDAITRGLREALEKDERVFIMGEDVGAYDGAFAVTRGFLGEFGPERIRDTPISESAIVGSAVGAALAGLRPIVEIMTINFTLLAMDQIINNAAKLRYMSNGQFSVPLVLRTVTGGGGQLGATHSQSFEGWYASVPGLKVAVPSTPYDALGLLRSAVEDANPVIFAEHALLYGVRGQVPEEQYQVPLGSASVRREGADITIVGYSRMAQVADQAAEMLARQGTEAEVIDLRTLQPLDMETITESVKKTGRAVIVEEVWKTGGFAGEIASAIQEEVFDYLDGPVVRVAGPRRPHALQRRIGGRYHTQRGTRVERDREAFSFLKGVPLATELAMPQMGYDMQEGTVVRWLKSEGAQVELGEAIAEIETDKAVVEFESYAAGVLHHILVTEGTTVPVGQVIAIVGAEDESPVRPPPPEPAPTADAEPDADSPAIPLEAPADRAPADGVDAAELMDEERMFATPAASKIAQERSVDLAEVLGTGPGGRIVKQDVLDHWERGAGPPAEAPPAAATNSSPW